MKRLSAITIWLPVIALLLAGCTTHPPRLNEGDWITLLDGTEESLNKNWRKFGESNWRVADGAVQADKSAIKASSYLVSRDSYFRDFELRVEFWVSNDANSGIFMRCLNPLEITDTSCYEANIFDQRPDPKYSTGAIVYRAAVNPVIKAGDRWNTYEITLRGDRISVWLNGNLTVDFLNKDLRRGGPIALQHGMGVVKFRKVEIRPL